METKYLSFPLYDYLSQFSSSGEKWDKISTIINTLSLEEAETIYALIYHHYLLTNNDHDGKLNLYNSKIFSGGKGLVFTVHNLPEALQKIIINYVNLITE